MHPKHIEALRSMTTSWDEAYRQEVVDDHWKFFKFAAGFPEDAPKTMARRAQLFKGLAQQVVFVKYHVTCRILANESEKNIARMRRFLDSQHFARKQTAPFYDIFFHTLCGARVWLFVEDLADIDFADLFAATMFNGLTIGHTSWRQLTQSRADAIQKMLRKDLEFDGYKVKFHIPPEYTPDKGNAFMHVGCAITGEMGLDKIGKIRKCKEMTGGDVLKWFMP